MRFYGLTYNDALSLPTNVYNDLSIEMHKIEAQEMLRNFTVASFSKMKDNSRKDTHRKISLIAYPEMLEQREVSPEQMVKFLNQG